MSDIVTDLPETVIEQDDSMSQTGESYTENNNNILKMGYIEIKKGKSDWKTYYGIILGGSFFWYKNQLDENPKDCIPSLQNFISLEMGNSTKNKDYVIGLINKDNSDTRDMIYISCSSIDEYKEWHSSIIEATGKDPMPAPKRERSMRKSGIGKKGVGDLANSRIGKSFIKSNLNQETLNVLSGLKKIIANENGKKLANKIEQDILMIITKTYLLLNNKKVDFEQLQKLYDPMNKAIRILCKCYAAKSRLNSNVLERALLKVGENIKMVEKILTEVLQPHLSSKSMFRLIYVFGYLSSTKFLELLIHEEDFEEDLQSFYDFMEYYSQFN